MTAQSVAQRKPIMTTYTIDEQNNITAFASAEEAAATTTTPLHSFASEQELAELAASWPPERLMAVWDSLPGVTPVKGVKNTRGALSRIWARIQGLGEAAAPEAEPAKPKVGSKAKARAQAANGAPTRARPADRRAPLGRSQ